MVTRRVTLSGSPTKPVAARGSCAHDCKAFAGLRRFNPLFRFMAVVTVVKQHITYFAVLAGVSRYLFCRLSFLMGKTRLLEPLVVANGCWRRSGRV